MEADHPAGKLLFGDEEMSQISSRVSPASITITAVFDRFIVDVLVSGMADKDMGKITIYSPISYFIGIRQCTARDFAPNAHVIEFLFHCAQAAFDVTQTLAIG